METDKKVFKLRFKIENYGESIKPQSFYRKYEFVSVFLRPLRTGYQPNSFLGQVFLSDKNYFHGNLKLISRSMPRNQKFEVVMLLRSRKSSKSYYVALDRLLIEFKQMRARRDHHRRKIPLTRARVSITSE